MHATVIIPAYNPEENLKDIVEKVWDLGNQIIVVDDGSGEDKMELFHSLSEKAIVIHHEANQGKGAAIKTALSYIKDNLWDCDVVGIMDADGQHLPEDMEKLLLRAANKEQALLLGVREIGKKMPLKSCLGNGITRLVFQAVSGVKVSDTQTGLRAFPISLLNVLLEVKGTRYEYETNVLFYCARNNIPMLEVPVKTIYHDRENSCSHFHPVRDSVRIYKDILKFSLSSLSSFVVDYLLFCGFMFVFPKTAPWILAGNILARVISGGYNYLMNCRFVFRTGMKAQSVLQYLALAAGILFLNSVILQFYAGVLAIPVYGAKILTEVSLFVISFAVQRKWIFHRVPEKAAGKGRVHA